MFEIDFPGDLMVVRLMAREEAGQKLTTKAIIKQLSPSIKKVIQSFAPFWAKDLKDQIKVRKSPGLLSIREILNCRLCEAALLNDLARIYGPKLTVRINHVVVSAWFKDLYSWLDDYVSQLVNEFMFLRQFSMAEEVNELIKKCPHRVHDEDV